MEGAYLETSRAVHASGQLERIQGPVAQAQTRSRSRLRDLVSQLGIKFERYSPDTSTILGVVLCSVIIWSSFDIAGVKDLGRTVPFIRRRQASDHVGYSRDHMPGTPGDRTSSMRSE